MNSPPLNRGMPLSMSTRGTRLKIACVSGDQGFRRKVTDMGLNTGTEIEIRQQEHGAVVICSGNKRYAIGAAMAHRIWVCSI